MHEPSNLTYFDQSFFFLLILPTIMNSTRGWPHLGLPILPTAREGSKVREKAKHERDTTLCISVYVLISATKRVVVL